MKRLPSALFINQVKKIIVRGDGYIDNITLASVEHLDLFHYAVEWMVQNQDEATGGWKNDIERKLEGYAPLKPGWISAMGQGQGLSLLSRAFHTFKDQSYIKHMVNALQPYTVDSKDGGVRAVFMNEYTWYEEYPMTPSLFVLNGFMFSMFGLYDFKSLLEKEFHFGKGTSPSHEVLSTYYSMDVDLPEAYRLVSDLYNDGLRSLTNLLPLYDGGSRSFYDLRHFQLKMQPNIARWDYHRVHLTQLAAFMTISDNPIFERYFKYWTEYTKGKVAKHN